MIRRLLVGLSILLALAPAAPPVAAQAPTRDVAPGVRVGVDRRVELLAIVFKLAGVEPYTQDRFHPYVDDVARQFGPFRSHPAVALAHALSEHHETAFDAVVGLAVRLTDSPALAEAMPLDSAPDPCLPPGATRQFLAALRRFVADSRAEAFFAAHRMLYDSADARLRRLVARDADLAWFGPYFGAAPDRDFVVVPLLANSGTNFGPCARPVGGRAACYAILGHERTDSAGLPVYGADFVPTLVHELTHGYVNRLVDVDSAAFARSAPQVHALVAAAMNAQAYGPREMIYESLVRAAVDRYLRARGDTAAERAYLANERARSWLWLDELSALLGRYEADRRTYPTLAAFMPHVAAYFDSLPARLPAMQRAYDLRRPHVASISVPTGDTAVVDPGPREIVVRFERPVRRTFGAVSPLPDAGDRFPPLTGQALDSAGTTFRLGVRLAPGRAYAFQLNSPSGNGLRTVDGGVPLAPYVVRFRTRPAAGQGGR